MRAPSELIRDWLGRRVPAEGLDWLDGQTGRLGPGAGERELTIALGLIPRRLGKSDLDLTADELAAADAARPGWDPGRWTVDMAARVLALLAFARDGEAFVALFPKLCRNADVAEAIALYSGLPLYPAPERLTDQAAEGLRGNIRAVFEAVAHRSPYPRERFDEDRWNQMVLKALFIGAALAPIQGLDARANPVLARIMCDYAHERWAAGRPVTPELWRCVGPFADGDMVGDLERVAASVEPKERAAAALALSANGTARARLALERLHDEASRIRANELGWGDLAPAR